jgi:Holliday junction resolvase RusA-like endonuclease
VVASVIELELPYAPSANHYYRNVGYRTLISREGRRYRESVGIILAAKRIRPLRGKLLVQIDLRPPDRRKRDVDNALKGLLDALQHGGAYEDDAQIMKLVVWKRDPVPGGKVDVVIEEIPP